MSIDCKTRNIGTNAQSSKQLAQQLIDGFSRDDEIFNHFNLLVERMIRSLSVVVVSHIAVQSREKTEQERSKRGVGSGKSIILVFSPLLLYDGMDGKL